MSATFPLLLLFLSFSSLPYLVAPAEPAGFARPPLDPGRDQGPVARAVDLRFFLKFFFLVAEVFFFFHSFAVSTFSTSSSLFSLSLFSHLDIVPEGRVFLLGPGALLGVSSVLARSSGSGSGVNRGGGGGRGGVFFCRRVFSNLENANERSKITFLPCFFCFICRSFQRQNNYSERFALRAGQKKRVRVRTQAEKIQGAIMAARREPRQCFMAREQHRLRLGPPRLERRACRARVR